jgi:hypothetical protein
MKDPEEPEGSEETEDGMDSAPPVSRNADEEDFPSLDELIGTFLREPSLMPVAVVILGTGGAFGAALLILTGLDRNPFAAGALILIAGMTVDVSLRARKEPAFRNLALLIGLVWAASVALALLALATGIASS